jgi:hypothetical protein
MQAKNFEKDSENLSFSEKNIFFSIFFSEEKKCSHIFWIMKLMVLSETVPQELSSEWTHC